MWTPYRHLRNDVLTGCLLVLLAGGISACGGASTEATPVTSSTTASVSGTSIKYTGNPPATADVQAFKLNVWDNLAGQNRCGTCHGTGGQAPTFVQANDINQAYAAALTVANLANPGNSRMVTKVAGGHNCWLASSSACADLIRTYITGWAGGISSVANVIALTAPQLRDPGASKSFPASSALFASTVHPLLTAHCAECHVDSASNAQSPFFADSDPDKAYEAARAKMDIDTPGNSRFVLRLRNEFHNCWSNDCADDADVMQAAIAAFSGQIAVTVIDPQLVTSKALTLPDGIVASGGARHEQNVIALYQFKTGQGNTAYDTSGVNSGMHLTLSGGVGWVGGWGIDISSGKAQASTTDSKKLYDMITTAGEYSIEAWVVPANVTQEGPARIISYSAGTTDRNFTLGQTQYNYDFLQRSSNTDANGEPQLSTADADEDLQATLQHVVATYDPVNGRRLYVNGVFTGDVDPVTPGNLLDWDSSYAFVLGNEVSGDRQWQGKLRLVAIHNRALTPAQIEQNFLAGVGEKFYLLFNVAGHTGITDTYILIEVSQFDNYSYLFNQPVFISLDPAFTPNDIPVAGMRIGINGKEASAGQAYRNLDTVITPAFYNPGAGQRLSDLGTVIALEKGADQDEFFLTFEVLGNSTNIVLEPVPLQPAPPADLPPASGIGLRSFDEVDATMSAMTGVARNQADVANVYDMVRQQLPVVENIDGFLAAHQMAISQLAIEYCNALLEDQGQISRANYFSGFNFSATADNAFNSATQRDLIIVPLTQHIMNSGVSTQPDPVDVAAEIDSLIQILTNCAFGPGATCASSARTLEVVKASCAAALGSAAMLLQ
jgi:mono/diheme cytochrome c family protein